MPILATATGRSTLKSLQVGRALAALAVVLFHANAFLALPKYFGREPLPMFRGGQSGVDFFFVLSGMVIFLAHERDLKGEGRPLSFLCKRIRRVYPALWIALTGVVFAYVAFPSLRPTGVPDWLTIVRAYVTWPATEVEPLLAVEWTLRHEALFYLLFAACLASLRVGLVLVAVVGLGSIYASFVDPPHASTLFSPYNLLFAFGVGVAFIHRHVALPQPWLWAAAGVLIYGFAWSGFSVGSPPDARLPLAAGLGAALMLAGFAAVERRGRIAVPAILTFLGDASYAIYLVHFPLLSAAAKVAMVLRPHAALPDFAWALLLAVAATIAGLGFHILAERPVLRLLGATSRPRFTPREMS